MVVSGLFVVFEVVEFEWVIVVVVDGVVSALVVLK